MHEWGDSGITAVFLALIIAVLISLGVAQQARARAARCQEIRRLQFEAAQEAQREEAEAAAEYKSMVGTRNAICAICSSISNTRCSRCKSVRYCSPACQLLHWKQGHKQECRAPDPPSSGSSIASSRIFSDDFSRSSSTSESRTVSEISEFQETQNATHFEFLRTTSSNGAIANGALLKPKKVLFPYKSFVRFFNYDRLGVPPCGLINCGNSCFANVVLQCLTYTRPLTAYLLAELHGNKCTRNDWCFMCELQDHVFRVRKEQNAFSPIRILSGIRKIGNHLGYGRQEDAHEFMRFAIDSMQLTCLDEFGGEKSVDARSQETTLIHHIFGGHLQSQVQCMQCRHESNRYEKMMDLAVEIQGSVETLEDALAQFTAPEWLDGDNKYKCDRCNAYVKGRKRLTLHEAPNILTIALKRFQSGKFGKLNKRVTFPEELDMMPYMSGNGDRPPAYLLYAVVVHVDMLNASFFGHYICYVKDSQGIWYKIDDSKVKEVDIEKVISQKAYMLFYRRSAARPAPEMDDEGSTVNLPAPVRPYYEDLGVVNVYQEASRHVSGMTPAVGGTMGLHAMVDPEQREGYFEGGPQTVKAHAFVNGEHVTTQSSSWERDVVCESNDDEISVSEDSGFVASSSSHSVISPTSSSHLSTEEPGVVRKVLVCNPPGSSIAEDTKVPSRDLVSPMSSELADITLHVNSLDKPLTPKIGKRRLDEGLTPLPAPKPLDTDQLPAWPTSSNGRSSPSPPVCHSAANQINGILPNAHHPARQKYLVDRTGESPAPPASPVQHILSSDQACFAASAEPGFDSERIYLEMMNFSESAGTSDEDRSGRAKRQHVEVDRSDLSPMERVARLGGMVQAPEQPDVSELDRRDMEWNEVPQTGYPGSVAVSGPVFDSCADVLPPHTNYCAPAGEVQTFPSSLRQVLLDEQVKDGSTQPFHTDETLAETPDGHPPCLEKAIEGIEESLECDLWSTMQTSLPSNMMVYEAPGGSALLDNCVSNEVMQCEGAAGIESMGNSEFENLSCKDPEAGTMLPLLNGQLEDLLLQTCENAPQLDTCEPRPSPIPSHLQCTTEDVVWTSSWKENALPVDKQDPEVVTAETAAPAKVHRQKSTVKPLFARGFLNRGYSPVLDSTSTSGSTGIAGRTSKETHRETEGKLEDEEKGTAGRCNGAENVHASLNNPVEDPSSVPTGNGCQVATTSASVGIGNGCLPTASSNGAGSSSASHVNAKFEEAVNSYGNGGLRNGVQTDDRQGHGEVKQRNKAGTSSKGKRSAAAHVGNGTSTIATEEQATRSGQVARSSFARPSSGKQKQGRNESCHCGSQRKWKKCCGKSEGMAPEISKRRLII